MSGKDTVAACIKPGRDDMGHGVDFNIGRGQKITTFCLGRERPIVPGNDECTVNQSVLQQPLVPATTSTPVAQNQSQPLQLVNMEVLGDLISDLAKRIGEDIKASLTTLHQPAHTKPQIPDSQPVSCIDPSQLKVVVQSKTSPPPHSTLHSWSL